MPGRKKSTSGAGKKRSSGRTKLSASAVRDLELMRGKARSARGGALGPTSVTGRMQPATGRIQPPGMRRQSPQKRI